MSTKDSVSFKAPGVGFAGLLTLIFVTLKLTGVITWSWVWVLSPLWITAILSVLFLLVFLLIALVVFLVTDGKRRG